MKVPEKRTDYEKDGQQGSYGTNCEEIATKMDRE